MKTCLTASNMSFVVLIGNAFLLDDLPTCCRFKVSEEGLILSYKIGKLVAV